MTAQRIMYSREHTILGGDSISYAYVQSDANNVKSNIRCRNATNAITLNQLSISNQSMLEDVIEEARRIFTNELQDASNSMKNFNINYSVKIGENNDFSSQNQVPELCKVQIKYVTLINEFDQYVRQPELFLYPQTAIPSALAKYYDLQNSDIADSIDFSIVLNPYMFNSDAVHKFYLGVDGNPNYDEYDLLTILLRGIAEGCGFHSEIKQYNNSLFIRFPISSEYYLSIFDSYLMYIDEDTWWKTSLAQVLYNIPRNLEDSVLNEFLSGHAIYINNYKLQNEMEYQQPLQWSSDNLQVFHIDDEMSGDTLELKSSMIMPGEVIHAFTPKTKRVLNYLGWNFYFPTGGGPTVVLPSISMSDTIRPEQDNSAVVSNGNWGKLVIKVARDDGYMTLLNTSTISNVTNIFNFSNDSISLNNLIRDKETGYAMVDAIYTDYQTNQTATEQSLLAIAPEIPRVQIDTIFDIENDDLYRANLSFYAKGAAKGYEVHCVGLLDNVNYHISLPQQTRNFQIPTDLDTMYTYRIEVKAKNNAGSTSYVSYLYGTQNGQNFTVLPQVYNNSTLHYSVMYNNHVVDVPATDIRILNTSGILIMTGTPYQNDIDISSLVRGYYILSITLDTGNTINVLFLKR